MGERGETPGRLVLVTGAQAAGKTTVGRALAAALPRAVHVDGDAIHAMIVSGEAPYDLPPTPEGERQLRLRYRGALRIAATYADAGFDAVVTDNVFGDHLGLVLGEAAALSARVHLVVLAPSRSTIAGREARRGKTGYTESVTIDLLADAVDALPPIGIRVDSTGHDAAETVAEVLDRLDDALVPRAPSPVGVPVLGADVCRAGWVGVVLGAGDPFALLAGDAEALVAAAQERAGPLAAVGFDIPIGLPDSGPRLADRLARLRLPPVRKSSVFPTPTRSACAAPTWVEANEAHRAATGGTGLSQQGFGLVRRILEVDALVRDGSAGAPVLEVHPEVSFAAMDPACVVPSKRRADGVRARSAALGVHGIAVPASPGAGHGTDDLLDACAVAWTVARWVRGEAESLPDPPEVFSDGLSAAITV